MAGQNPYANRYRNNQILTATPQQLVLMLYDRILRDLRQATEAIEAKDLNSSNKMLQHVEEILEELLLGLDLELPAEAGGDIAVNLGRLYDYYIVRCREANIAKDVNIIAELQKQIGDLRGTWAEAIIRAKQEAPPGEGADCV